MFDDAPGSCAPATARGWRRVQTYPPQSLGADDSFQFSFYDQGTCLAGWLIDISATRNTDSDVWRGLAVISARDGLAGNTWRKVWGDASLGPIELGGALRVWVPYPFVDVRIIGAAGAAETGTVRAQGIAADLAAQRGAAFTRVQGFRVQQLDGGSPSAATYVVPPGAIAFTVAPKSTSVTDSVKVTERAGDADLGWFSIDPTKTSAAPDWRPLAVQDPGAAAASANAIILGGANGSSDPWVVRWLFETASMSTGP